MNTVNVRYSLKIDSIYISVNVKGKVRFRLSLTQDQGMSRSEPNVDFGIDERRIAIEAIATLVHIKSTLTANRFPGLASIYVT